MPRNLTIAFQDSEMVPNNFEHQVRPFMREVEKTPNVSSVKLDTNDLLSMAKRYNNTNIVHRNNGVA